MGGIGAFNIVHATTVHFSGILCSDWPNIVQSEVIIEEQLMRLIYASP